MGIVNSMRSAKNRAARKAAIKAAAKAPANGITMTVLGDSFVAGEPCVKACETFPYKLAALMGWTVRYADGQGGTGYAARPEGNVSESYPERISGLTAVRSDVLLISGGYNDTWHVLSGTTRLADVQSAVDATLEVASKVGGLVLVVGPFWSRIEEVPPEAYELNDYLRGAAQARDFRFIDVLKDNWVTPENRAGIISDDNTHPSPAGHDYIAERLAAALTALLSAK